MGCIAFLLAQAFMEGRSFRYSLAAPTLLFPIVEEFLRQGADSSAYFILRRRTKSDMEREGLAMGTTDLGDLEDDEGG